MDALVSITTLSPNKMRWRMTRRVICNAFVIGLSTTKHQCFRARRPRGYNPAAGGLRMRRSVTALTLFVIGLGSSAIAQQGTGAPRPAPTRPPLFFSETWKALTTPPDDHGAWPASQGG